MQIVVNFDITNHLKALCPFKTITLLRLFYAESVLPEWLFSKNHIILVRAVYCKGMYDSDVANICSKQEKL